MPKCSACEPPSTSPLSAASHAQASALSALAQRTRGAEARATASHGIPRRMGRAAQANVALANGARSVLRVRDDDLHLRLREEDRAVQLVLVGPVHLVCTRRSTLATPPAGFTRTRTRQHAHAHAHTRALSSVSGQQPAPLLSRSRAARATHTSDGATVSAPKAPPGGSHINHSPSECSPSPRTSPTPSPRRR